MALPATVRRFEINLSDVDHHYYDQLTLRVAQHPSETDLYMLTRLIAYCHLIHKGVEMSKSGLCNVDLPPLHISDLTGQIIHWVDIGLPSPERIHKASKVASEVSVYTHKSIARLREKLEGKPIFRRELVALFEVDAKVLKQLELGLDRVNEWAILINEQTMFIEQLGQNFQLSLLGSKLA